MQCDNIITFILVEAFEFLSMKFMSELNLKLWSNPHNVTGDIALRSYLNKYQD